MLKGKGDSVVIVSLVITFVLFLLSKNNFSSVNFFQIISQLLSLVGTVLLSITFILGIRLNFLGELFGGVDKVHKRHHLFGVLSFVMLVNHLIFLALKNFPDFSSINIYFLPSTLFAYNTGIFALYILILSLIFTILIHLPRQWWLISHRAMSLVLVFSIIHVAFIDSDVSRFLLLKIWILGWMMGALFVSIKYMRYLFIFSLIVFVLFIGISLMSQKPKPNFVIPTPTNSSKCIITINNQKYDVTNYRNQHPTGDVFNCDTDMSTIFSDKHPDSYLRKMEKYKIN